MMGLPQGFEGEMRGRFSMGHFGMPQMGGGMDGAMMGMSGSYRGGGAGHEGMMGGGGGHMMMQGAHGAGFGGGYELSPNVPRMTAGSMYALQQQQRILIVGRILL